MKNTNRHGKNGVSPSPAWNDSKYHVLTPQNQLQKQLPTDLHVFCDASVRGIAAVCYLRSTQPDGQVQITFVFGKAKLAPPHATTIPCLELCATVLAVEITELVVGERAIKPCSVTYYSDSKVVLSYIANETRRFYTYVANRVERIRKSSSPEEWRYALTHLNPANCATRSVKANELENSSWLRGPSLLRDLDGRTSASESPTNQELTTDDPEVRSEVKAFAMARRVVIGTTRFARFSSLSSLMKSMCKLISAARSHMERKRTDFETPDHTADGQPRDDAVQIRKRAEMVIIKNVQQEAFVTELGQIKSGTKLSQSNELADASVEPN